MHTAPATPAENAKAKQQRCRSLQGALRENDELSHPDLRVFLEEELGNLPLAVALNGQIIRDVGSVTELIELFKTAKLEEVDAMGRNRITDRHLLGLYTSVRVAAERIKAEPSLSEAKKRAVMQLLVIMSVLPGSETPTELLRREEGMLSSQHLAPGTKVVMRGLTKAAELNGRTGSIVKWVSKKGQYKVDLDGSTCPVQPIYLKGSDGNASHVTSTEAFETAVATLRRHGLLQRSGAGSRLVGNMHQLMQRCVRERIVKRTDPVGSAHDDDAGAIARPRSVLAGEFEFDHDDNTRWGWLRELAPCVARLWTLMDTDDDGDRGDKRLMQATPADGLMLSDLGSLLLLADGDAKGAKLVEQQALCFFQREAPHDPIIADMNRHLAQTDDQLGLHDKAEELYKIAMELYGPSRPAFSTAMGGLAETYRKMGRHEAALKLNIRVRARESAGSVDATSVMNNMALNHSALGQHPKAVTLLKKVLAARRRTLPADHPHIAQAIGNLAEVHGALGQCKEAMALQKEALAFMMRVHPADHPDIAFPMGNLAMTQGKLGQHAEALTLHEETLALRKRVLPAEHPDFAVAMNNMAETFSALGRCNEALVLHQETLAFRTRAPRPDHPDIAESMTNVAGVLSRLGRHGEALELSEKALAFYKRVLPPDHPDIAMAMENLASAFNTLGRHGKALELNRDALALKKRVLPPDHPDIAMSVNNLAFTCDKLGQRDKALELHEEALAFRKRTQPPDHPAIAMAMGNLASAYIDLGRHDEALTLVDKAHAIWSKSLPPTHPNIARAVKLKRQISMMQQAAAQPANSHTSSSNSVKARLQAKLQQREATRAGAATAASPATAAPPSLSSPSATARFSDGGASSLPSSGKAQEHSGKKAGRKQKKKKEKKKR